MNVKQNRIFVLMPFGDEFDDVYMVIRDAVNEAGVMTGRTLRCWRADNIAKPGRITEQIIEAIREADIVIADLSGNNPNVMYELGYAHALGKPAIIVNQEVRSSPFDVKDFRQIIYDRKRLVKDCRPSLIAALCDVFGESRSTDATETDVATTTQQAEMDEEVLRSQPLRPGNATITLLQEIQLKLQYANVRHDGEEVQRLAAQLRNLLGRITVASPVDSNHATNTAAVAGNCAVEVEKAELGDEAEDLYRRTIGLFPQYHGVRLQYADFLADAARIDEAREQLHRASELKPDDPRIENVRLKIALKSGGATQEMGQDLRKRFEEDPGRRELAAAYLMYLDRTKAPIGQFEAACQKWREASSPERKWEADRALADHLASSGVQESYSKAVQIYESLLASPHIDTDDRFAVLHNVATLYSITDNRDSALARWREAYSLNQNDSAVRSAFSQRLASWGKLDMAMAVIQGKPLPAE